ncbi:MAG: tetratricopeptide repeat protein [Pseudomonadota bacterium]
MRRRRLLWIVPCLGLLLCPGLGAAKTAPARITVAVAPFATASTEEYWWMGFALADVLEERLGQVPTVNTLSIKQWNAVLRERDLPPGPLSSDDEILRSGKLLGARYVVTGSYQAKWPDMRVLMRVLDTQNGQVVLSTEARDRVERVLAIEGQLAIELCKLLGIKLPPAPVRPKNVYALRAAMVCKETAVMQSLGPRAEPSLPAGTVWQAKRLCDEALATSAEDPIALGALGVLQAVVGEKNAAELSLKRAVGYARRPGFADLGLFWVRYQRGKKDEAVAGLQAAVAKRPGYLHARGVLGQALSELGRHDEARKVWEEYLALSPAQPWALAQLGYTLARLGDIDGAIARSNQAIALVPDDAALYIERASREIDGKRWEQAEASLRKALELDPKLAVTYLRLGFVYLETKQEALAGAMFKKALAEADLESEQRVRGIACFDLAKVEARAKKVDAALTYLDQAINEGFTKLKLLDSDDDLAALRSTPRYKALQARLQQKLAAPVEEPKAGEKVY